MLRSHWVSKRFLYIDVNLQIKSRSVRLGETNIDVENGPFVDDVRRNGDFPTISLVIGGYPLNYCNVSADLWLGLRVQVDNPCEELYFADVCGQDLNVFRISDVSVTSCAGRRNKSILHKLLV